MSDIVVNDDVWRGNPTANLRLVHELGQRGLKLDSFFELKLKSSKYNSWYFGLDQADVSGGIDASVGFLAVYNLISNLYIYGAGRLTLLDPNARSVEIKNNNIDVRVNSDVHAQVYFGFGFSNDVTKPKKKELRNGAYWRVGQGFATPSTLAQILNFESTPDTNNNKLTSIFYGYPVTDELFGLPLEIYMSPGFTYHWPSDVQPGSFELNFVVMLYYTIKWPIRWRLSAGEGISWVNKVPYMEANSLAQKDYVPSNLMNYLDFSIGFNIGDIFGNEPLKQWWLGYYIHHRSSIFETAQHFGRISGGSNYHTIFVMWNY
jgi:outer membrane protein